MKPVDAPVATRPDAGDDDPLVRWMRGLTPAERLEVLQGFVDSVTERRRDQPAPVPGRA